jgi:hypothetical protein
VYLEWIHEVDGKPVHTWVVVNGEFTNTSKIIKKLTKHIAVFLNTDTDTVITVCTFDTFCWYMCTFFFLVLKYGFRQFLYRMF